MKLPLKHLWISLCLCLGVWFLFNLCLALRMDSVPRQMIREFRQQPHVDIVFLGNSLMASGLDQPSFLSKWSIPGNPPALFNAGFPASTTVEQDLFAREAFRYNKGIKYVVYGFYNDQLTATPHADWGTLVGNMSMAYYVEPGIAERYYFSDSPLSDKLLFRLVSLVPALREHSQLWKYVEQFRRTCSEMGMPAVKKNQFGRASDFDEMGIVSPESFDRTCTEAVEHSLPFAPPVKEIFQLAADHGAKVVVVEMPMPWKHRTLNYSSDAWLKYRDRLQKNLGERGITYIDASDWVTDDVNFLDALHLSETGAQIFSTHLAANLAGQVSRN